MIGGIQSGVNSMPAPDLQQMREQMFAKLDPDGDGQIDLSELSAESETQDARGPMPADFLEALQAADTDGDGMISEEEFANFEPPPPPDEAPAFMFDQQAQMAESDLAGSLLDILG